MQDFLQSITFEPGHGCPREQVKHDFKFIKDYYDLDVKLVHHDNIIRFVPVPPCEEENKNAD